MCLSKIFKRSKSQRLFRILLMFDLGIGIGIGLMIREPIFFYLTPTEANKSRILPREEAVNKDVGQHERKLSRYAFQFCFSMFFYFIRITQLARQIFFFYKSKQRKSHLNELVFNQGRGNPMKNDASFTPSRFLQDWCSNVKAFGNSR